MDASTLPHVIFLPGGIMPASIQYAPLLNVLKDDIQPLLKDLEVYSGDVPDPNYQLCDEVDALEHAADRQGFNRFHLVGYSGGGAVALAFIATYPERVKSLALIEPAVIPNQEWLQLEHDYWNETQQAMQLPPDQQMREFFRINVARGVNPLPPPPGDPPDWMAKRPAGLKALVAGFATASYPMERFRDYHGPVYLAVGTLSNPIERRKADLMSNLFPNFKLEIFEGVHHFNPPQRTEPERFAKALTALWKQVEMVH